MTKKNKNKKKQQNNEEKKPLPTVPIVEDSTDEQELVEQKATDNNPPSNTPSSQNDSSEPSEKIIAELPPPDEKIAETQKIPNQIEKKNDFAFGLIMGLMIVIIVALIVFLLQLDYASKLEVDVNKLTNSIANLDPVALPKKITSFETTINKLLEKDEQLRAELVRLQTRCQQAEKEIEQLRSEIKTQTAIPPPFPIPPPPQRPDVPPPSTPQPNQSLDSSPVTNPPAESTTQPLEKSK